MIKYFHDESVAVNDVKVPLGKCGMRKIVVYYIPRLTTIASLHSAIIVKLMKPYSYNARLTTN